MVYTELLIKGTTETIIMVIASLSIGYIIGLPLGVFLEITKPGGLIEKPLLNKILGWVVNIGRSIPFIILMMLLIPFTRTLVGTSIGISGSIVPLSVSAIPFIARIVENTLEDVDQPTIRSIHAMGASPLQTIKHGYLSEALPSLLRGMPIVAIALVGYSAMAGATGGGGLGDIAIRYGYYNYNTEVMLMTLVILIIIVESFQHGFHWLGDVIDKKRRSVKS